jgi:hypothetical protein
MGCRLEEIEYNVQEVFTEFCYSNTVNDQTTIPSSVTSVWIKHYNVAWELNSNQKSERRWKLLALIACSHILKIQIEKRWMNFYHYFAKTIRHLLDSHAFSTSSIPSRVKIVFFSYIYRFTKKAEQLLCQHIFIWFIVTFANSEFAIEL